MSKSFEAFAFYIFPLHDSLYNRIIKNMQKYLIVLNEKISKTFVQLYVTLFTIFSIV